MPVRGILELFKFFQKFVKLFAFIIDSRVLAAQRVNQNVIQSEEYSDAFCPLFFLKGTNARDFHSLFLNFFLHLSLTNGYKTQYGQHFRKNS